MFDENQHCKSRKLTKFMTGIKTFKYQNHGLPNRKRYHRGSKSTC